MTRLTFLSFYLSFLIKFLKTHNMSQLSTELKAIIVDRWQRNQPQIEIAQELGINPVTVNRTIKRFQARVTVERAGGS